MEDRIPGVRVEGHSRRVQACAAQNVMRPALFGLGMCLSQLINARLINAQLVSPPPIPSLHC